MSPNKVETADHGYHCPSDMVLRMRRALVRGTCASVLSHGIVIVNPSEKVHETEVMLENRKYY